MSRKRKRGEHGSEREREREHQGPTRLQSANAVKHALLAQYYPSILTLRQYLLRNLPWASKARRKKIEAFQVDVSAADTSIRVQLAKLLDTTLIGLHVGPEDVAKAHSQSRLQQWIDYSQKDDSHVTLSTGDASAIHLQSEVGPLRLLHQAWAPYADPSLADCRLHHLAVLLTSEATQQQARSPALRWLPEEPQARPTECAIFHSGCLLSPLQRAGCGHKADTMATTSLTFGQSRRKHDDQHAARLRHLSARRGWPRKLLSTEW